MLGGVVGLVVVLFLSAAAHAAAHRQRKNGFPEHSRLVELPCIVEIPRDESVWKANPDGPAGALIAKSIQPLV